MTTAIQGTNTGADGGLLSNYSYPITSGLLGGLTSVLQQPSSVLPSAASATSPTSSGNTTAQGGPWSQLAYQMAGAPKQGGMYQPVATPAGTAGTSNSSSLASLAPLLGLLGAGGSSSLLGQGAGALGNALSGLFGMSNLTPNGVQNSVQPGLSQIQSELDADLSGSGSPINYSDLSAQNLATLAGQNTSTTGSGLTDADLDYLFGGLSSPSGAGGQAATNSDVLGEVQSGGLDSLNQGGLIGSTGNNASLGSNVGGGLNVASGLLSGTPAGYASAGLGATSLAGKNGLFGAGSGTAASLANNGLSALGLYQGLQQGGVTGDLSAAANAAKLAGSIGGASGLLNSGAASALGAAGSAVALPLSAYNMATNWQSGDTGLDAEEGASTGASAGALAGTYIFPVLGTAVGGALGALIGGAAGAVSSAFGGGKQDAETNNMYSVNSAGSTAASSLNPAQSFQYLAGVMDAKNDTAGHATELEQAFGREGEGSVLTGMAGQINSALQSGSITSNTSASTVFNNVVVPWLTSKGVPASSLTFKDVKGTSSGTNLQQSLTNLVGAYMNGSLTSSSKIGVSGQAAVNLPTLYGT